MATKTKSSISETPKKAITPATPRVSKKNKVSAKSDSDTQSPLQNSRLSVDRSPQSVTSKSTLERRSPKITTPTEKQPTRVAKGSELQAQLNVIQEDLKKAKEQIALLEKEKEKAVDELKEAQRVAGEANEKLREALVAQKRAEESSEIEKFRAVELEQAGIEEAQKKELEWQKQVEAVRNQHSLDVATLLSTTDELRRLKHEVEAVRNQHSLDVATLLSTTDELRRLKHDLAMACDAKNQALNHADDATKIAEIHAGKAEILSDELARLKSLLDSKLEKEANESQTVLELKEEIESLKQKLEKMKVLEEKLMEKEASIEQLNVDLEAAKMAESYTLSLAEEWRTKVDELQIQVEQAKSLERSASESLASVMKQLEGSNDLLHESESEISSLSEKLGLLEMTVGRQRGDIEESEGRLNKAKEETSKMEKMVESLKSELETVKEEKNQALNNEKLAASSVQILLEEKHKLINELENSRDEEEKSKSAMESLASAIHEVSAEAREAKEKLLVSQAEHDDYKSQIENLKMALEATNEKYKTMLDDARCEINNLKSSIEQSNTEFQNSKVEWEQKELQLVDCVKKSEEEIVSMEKELNRMVNLLKQTEEEACTMKEEEAHLKDNLKEVESEVVYMQEVLAETKSESLNIKGTLLDKENQLQSIIQENEELRTKEAASQKKVEELSNLLAEATAKKQTEENGELTDSEKEYDLLPKVVEFSEENGHGREEKPIMELPLDEHEELKLVNVQEENHVFKDDHLGSAKPETMNLKSKEEESKGKGDDLIGEYKMWESCKIEKKEFSSERETEPESFEEEVDSKVDSSEGFDKLNRVTSTEIDDDAASLPSKQQQQKKKKPLLRKFGSLLKKKGTSNQK